MKNLKGFLLLFFNSLAAPTRKMWPLHREPCHGADRPGLVHPSAGFHAQIRVWSESRTERRKHAGNPDEEPSPGFSAHTHAWPDACGSPQCRARWRAHRIRQWRAFSSPRPISRGSPTSRSQYPSPPRTARLTPASPCPRSRQCCWMQRRSTPKSARTGRAGYSDRG